jgi:hypothetical protein
MDQFGCHEVLPLQSAASECEGRTNQARIHTDASPRYSVAKRTVFDNATGSPVNWEHYQCGILILNKAIAKAWESIGSIPAARFIGDAQKRRTGKMEN